MNPLNMKYCCQLVILACGLFFLQSTTQAQMLIGPWVEEADQQIEQHRKADVHLIVLDSQGNGLAQTTIELKQLQGPLLVGIETKHGRVSDVPEPLLSVVSLLSYMPTWGKRLDQPTPVSSPWYETLRRRVDPMTHPDRIAGPLIPTDPGHWPDYLVRANRADQAKAFKQRALLGSAAEYVILLGDVLRKDNGIENRLGQGLVRETLARLSLPTLSSPIGFMAKDALIGPRLQRLLDQALAFQATAMDFDFVAISFSTSDLPSAQRLGTELRRLNAIDLDVFVMPLEIGGDTDIDAATKMETMLRMIMAQPNIKGISFPGTTPEHFTERNASLLDESGELTAVGNVVHRLITETWTSTGSYQTDVAGSLYARLFTGLYTLTVETEDGPKIETLIRVTPQSDGRQIHVVQAIQRDAEE